MVSDQDDESPERDRPSQEPPKSPSNQDDNDGSRRDSDEIIKRDNR